MARMFRLDVCGNTRAQQITGTDANERISTKAANDLVRGDLGNDKVSSGYGNDKVVGNAGADELYGAGGNDALTCASGKGVLDGGKVVITGFTATIDMVGFARNLLAHMTQAKQASHVTEGAEPLTLNFGHNKVLTIQDISSFDAHLNGAVMA